MNAADVEILARKAGIDPHDMCEDPRIAVNNLARFAELVQAAEREDCAVLCDGVAEICAQSSDGHKRYNGMMSAKSCAKLIRVHD